MELKDEPGPHGHRLADAAEAPPEVETRRQNIERRLGAVENHLIDLEQRLNDRGVFSGDR